MFHVVLAYRFKKKKSRNPLPESCMIGRAMYGSMVAVHRSGAAGGFGMRTTNIGGRTFGLMRIFLLCLFYSLTVHAAQSSRPGECVVLLHGMARTADSMNKMEGVLLGQGYLVAKVDYPSRSERIEKLAGIAVAAGLDVCRQAGADRIHFVTK
jgi:hypothetical protein